LLAKQLLLQAFCEQGKANPGGVEGAKVRDISDRISPY
jgi:hypothetical protein